MKEIWWIRIEIDKQRREGATKRGEGEEKEEIGRAKTEGEQERKGKKKIERKRIKRAEKREMVSGREERMREGGGRKRTVEEKEWKGETMRWEGKKESENNKTQMGLREWDTLG